MQEEGQKQAFEWGVSWEFLKRSGQNLLNLGVEIEEGIQAHLQLPLNLVT